MQAGKRRSTARNGVISGSVWDSRMKIDEGKGGMKVFNGEENSGVGDKVCRRLKRNQSGSVSEKRKIGKTEPNEVIVRSPIQLRKSKSDSQRFPDEIEKTPIQLRKTRSDSHTCKENQIDSSSLSNVGQIQSGRLAVEVGSVDGDEEEDEGEEIEKNPIQLEKIRSDSQTCTENQIDSSSLNNVGQIKSPRPAVEDGAVDGDEEDEGEEIEKNQIQLEKTRSDSETCKENQINSISLSNVGQIKSLKLGDDCDGVDGGEEEGEEEEGDEDETEEDSVMEVEKKSFDSKEINIPEQKIKLVVNEEKLEQINRTPIPISSNVSKQTIQVKNHPAIDPELTEPPPCALLEEFEISSETQNKLQKSISFSNVSKQTTQVKNHPTIDPELTKPPPCALSEEFEISPQTKNKLQKHIYSNVTKHTTQVKSHPVIHQELRKASPFAVSEDIKRFPEPQSKLQKPVSSIVSKRTPQVKNHPVIHQEIKKPPPFTVSENFERFPETQSKLENIVDLVMWKDVPRSAFVFGFGTFILLSSSFTKDLNFSLISAISYMALMYLGAIFLFKSILCRGIIDSEESDQTHTVGEEEAIWFLELILPYLNEFLFKLRGLFSGNPATTMKLALFLFILARCGSSITIWKMAKLGFFGAFTVPKVCSSYSTQITSYGNFWIKRFWDAWDSCSHKKAVIAAVFTLVWNLSSVVARIWAAFMLIVAVRYYQQSLLREEWGERQDDDGPTVPKEKKGS